MWACVGEISYSQFAVGLTTAISAGRGKVLPEERVVDVATAVEVDQGSLSSSLGIVALGVGIFDGLKSGVEAVDVGLVVLGVVKLHDLGRDVGLKGAVVICVEGGISASVSSQRIRRQ